MINTAESLETIDLDTLRAKYSVERGRRIRPDRVEVLIIGAGFGGLLTGAFLRDAGATSLRLMDEAGDVGGTWYWNRYPGVRCAIETFQGHTFHTSRWDYGYTGGTAGLQRNILLKPWYRYMCKRPGLSDLYLQAFNRPNVTLVDTADAGGITSVTETSVIVGDTAYEVDCIIFATGFETGVSGVVSGTLPVYGRDGRSLLQAWGRGPRTLHGFYTHGFPNLFQLGAIQNANSVNFVHILQEQARHIAAVISRC